MATVALIDMEGFRDSMNRINWDLYRSAQVNNGERCYQCKSYLVTPRGHQELCIECKNADNNSDELRHSRFIRCPKCRHLMNAEDVAEWTDYKLYQDQDDVDVTCYECEHEFKVQTEITYEFISPAVGKTEVD